MVENLRFFSLLLKFFILSSFPRSAYLCTLFARQPRISAPNSFAPAATFRQNQIKNGRSIVIKTAFLSFLYANLKVLRLKTCGFLRFCRSFLFYPRFLAQRTLVRFSLVSQGFLLQIRSPLGSVLIKNSLKL